MQIYVSKRSQYSEDLKAFLSPVLEHKDATKVKKYGQRVKSYAQFFRLIHNKGYIF